MCSLPARTNTQAQVFISVSIQIDMIIKHSHKHKILAIDAVRFKTIFNITQIYNVLYVMLEKNNKSVSSIFDLSNAETKASNNSVCEICFFHVYFYPGKLLSLKQADHTSVWYAQ